MTDSEWRNKVSELSKQWLRRGCATPQDVDAILTSGPTYWAADRINKIARDIERDIFGLHTRPLWYRRWRNKWGEQVS